MINTYNWWNKLFLTWINFCHHNKCQFDIAIQDDTGSATITVLKKIEEELLSLTAIEIYDICCTKINIIYKIVHYNLLIYTLKKLSFIVFFRISESIGSTLTCAIQTSEKDIYSSSNKVICKKSEYIFSEIVHHVPYRQKHR